MSDLQNEQIKKATKKKPTRKAIADVYEKKAANMSATAIALGVSRTTLYEWREKDPKLDALMHEVEESLIDFTESKLLTQIKDDNMTAIIFHLKTKGKKRGYTEGEEIEVKQTNDLDLSGLSDEELDTMMTLLRKAKKK
ncbi:MAG: hypothetical protein IJK84_00425 [Bacteroidales bacterium]|nr:hypothetical protein [Bacteroidales bacterium]